VGSTLKSLTFPSDRVLVEPKDVDDIYSGMWWQSVQSFLSIDFSILVNLEGATFRVGNTHWGRLRMARDMLDFGVEHISFLMKFFTFGSNFENMNEATRAAHDILLGKLRQYSYNAFYESPFASLKSPPAFRSTIAVIPFGYQNKQQSNGARQFDPDYEVKHESLRATLASIWQLGIGRAVVVGGDGAAVALLFQEFQSTVTKTSAWNRKLAVPPPTMELAFIDYPPSENIPKAALMALQQALSPGASDVNATLQWLGTTDKAKWKHVYYSEPDLVLHTTPRVIKELAQALEANNVLFAHRFNFVAHASDFPPEVVGATKTMPAVGRYTNVSLMDPYDSDDECIWTGQDRGALKVKDCPDYWHQCGFHEKFGSGTAVEVEHAFRLYKPFELMRLKHGVGFAMASGTEIRNVCQVSKKPSVQGPTMSPEAKTTVKSLTFPSKNALVEPKDVDDIYSGMWWQSVQSFAPIDFSPLVNLEGATFRVGNTHWGRLRMARDMLDFGVEHISFLMKFFNFGSDYENMSKATKAAHDILLGKLRQYSSNVLHETRFSSLERSHAFRSTIAVIPFGYQNRVQSNGARQFDPDFEVKLESLRATLASIWQLGIGRAVVVGGDGAAVAQLFEEFNGKTSARDLKLPLPPPTMELAFIDYPPSENIPKAALMALQQALSPASSDAAKDANATLKWLGTTDKTKWKHVYYSEPDLVLHTTPRVIKELVQALEANNVLFAHRFNFVAHASDFPPDAVGTTKTMPAVGRYANVPVMDPYDSDDRCIWTSQDRDALKAKDCPDYWHQCGFHEKFGDGTAAEVEHAFRLYKPFELMRLKHGVGFAMASGTEIRNICEIQQKP
jgi:hypothetical protein